MIYFVQAADGQGPIKIGYTWGGMSQRLSALQCGSPVRLVCLGVFENGSMDGEFNLHKRFHESRVWAEWFEPTPALLAIVAKAQASCEHWRDYSIELKPARKGRWNPRHRRTGPQPQTVPFYSGA